MKSLWNRFKEKQAEFGWWVAVCSSVAALYPYEKHKNSLSLFLNSQKHRAIISYLEHKYSDVIKHHKENHPCDSTENKKIIWSLWWQGAEQVPEVIKLCQASIRKNAPDCEFIVVTKDNLEKYLSLPSCILEKVEAKTFSLTHFSDIIRVNLLKKYGGLWLDATIFITKDIPESIFNRHYFTRKVKPVKMGCVSQARWTNGIMASQKDNPYIEFAVDFYNEYWKKQTALIEYFLQDYITEIAYRNFAYYRNMLDSVEENSPDTFNMVNVINEPYEETAWKQLQNRNLFLYVSWKRKYVRNGGPSSNPTLYGKLIEEYHVG